MARNIVAVIRTPSLDLSDEFPLTRAITKGRAILGDSTEEAEAEETFQSVIAEWEKKKRTRQKSGLEVKFELDENATIGYFVCSECGIEYCVGGPPRHASEDCPLAKFDDFGGTTYFYTKKEITRWSKQHGPVWRTLQAHFAKTYPELCPTPHPPTDS